MNGLRVRDAILTRKRTTNNTFKNSRRSTVVVNDHSRSQHLNGQIILPLKGIAVKKTLGVKFDSSNIPFENHVNFLCKKASQKLPALDDFKRNIT